MNSILTKRTTGVLLTALLSLPYGLPAYAAANPLLGNACGLDIVLTLDVSGSIDSTELTQEKDAAKAFVDAFLPATPTLMGVVQFHTGATVVQDLTSNATDLKADIDAVSGGGSTNWEDGLLKARGLLEGGLDRDDALHPDLIVLFSDGDPTTSSGPGSDLADAVTQADFAKTSVSSMPIRIVAVGIGTSVTTANMQAISGPIVSPPAAVTKDTDVILSDFATLATTLGNLANALCSEEEKKDMGDDKVINKNSAYIKNEVSSKADTGDNWAGGSTGGAGGTGGSVANVGTGNDANGNTTGNAGNGGNGGIGGTVMTGGAMSVAGAATYANSNETTIDRCACNGPDSGDVFVKNKNRVVVKNIIRSKADSGDNSADGSAGGTGGTGGSVVNAGNDNDADGNTTGTGGNGGASTGGDGAAGGFVQSGSADSTAGSLTKVNRNITRVTR